MNWIGLKPALIRRPTLWLLMLGWPVFSNTPALLGQEPRLPDQEHWHVVAREGQRLPMGCRVIRDVDYVGKSEVRQTLDIYLPPQRDEQAVPLVVWIHGGGWRRGSKRNPPAVDQLLQRQVAVASIEYRLTDQATFPAQIHDCKAAIRFLRKNAKTLGINPERFAAWGASAGGHLVALVGTSGDVEALEGRLGVTGVSSRVQWVCDWFGPTELEKMNAQAGENGQLDHDAADSPESTLLGGPVQSRIKQARQASPLTYITPDDPPFLIMHGSADRLVPLAQSQALHNGLRAAGVGSRLIVVPDGGHGSWGPEYRKRAVDYLVQRLRPSSEQPPTPKSPDQ